MADFSLYIHIPFCVSKCRYCDFYSVAVDDAYLVNRYIDALVDEWVFYENGGILGDSTAINTIYIGGGTPSVLSVDMWGRLEDKLFSRIDKSAIKEWSVECNPESFSIEKARMYANSGVTRLTFGVQSLNARELSICGRAHSAERALEVLGDRRLSELFDSIGVDIIYALPGQTVNILDETLTSILSIPQVKHLSAYELTIAEGTPFGRHEKMLKLPDDGSSAEMYNVIGRRCAERGMRQYEVSNYALPGFESIHNKAYWSREPYIGLGASAHSYIHPKRWGNVSDIGRYISTVSAISADNRPIGFEEVLGPAEVSSEIIFLGLRNDAGLDEDDFAASVGIGLCEGGRLELMQKYVNRGLLKKAGRKWIPTSKGMLFADMMSRELMP
jgi:oxygen-independent coproporphyrinogen-3 oxidase